MRIVSIDVGIKNLAYCIMDNTNDNKSIKIIQWDVINLCGKKIICNCSFINKKVKKVKVVENKSCSKIHAKNQIDYIIPTLKLSIKKIKKMKLVELQELCSTYKIETLPGSKKEGILDMVIKTMSNKFLDSIGEQQSANEISMIDIGIAIKNEFDKLPLMMSADKIIIENQISPIANRMKTIQGMIAQYFIMNNKNNISFISASNKLKAYTKPLEDGEDKSNYLDRKKASTNITLTLMENEIYSEFKQFFTNHKKKDDLADAFLQGISFITTF